MDLRQVDQSFFYFQVRIYKLHKTIKQQLDQTRSFALRLFQILLQEFNLLLSLLVSFSQYEALLCKESSLIIMDEAKLNIFLLLNIHLKRHIQVIFMQIVEHHYHDMHF
jgi:hypothetical protein